ncbi:hypothetical protein BKN51_41670 [Amycolatopsis sp. BJA-103]|nr:hypothetical protein BKN51_41670 [Amycolatopsis sp. BJA-103]
MRNQAGFVAELSLRESKKKLQLSELTLIVGGFAERSLLSRSKMESFSNFTSTQLPVALE